MTSMNILLVDDRPENLRALTAIIEAPGRQIFTAGSGQEALRLMLRHDFAVVLLDVQMPGMDGFEVIRMMRARPRTALVPVIFVTAGAHGDQQLAGYQAGAVDYLLKPLDPHIVRCKVDVFLELYRQRAEIERQSAELSLLNAQLEGRVEQRTRELESANQQLETFVYSASHNLKTSLRSIVGLVSLVLADCETQIMPMDVEMLRRVANAAHHMSEVLAALLRLSDLRHATCEPQPMDLAEIARIVAASQGSESPDRQVQVSIPESLPIVADPALVRLILDILFDNAWKFTQGTDPAELRVGVLAEREPAVYFVRDNGAGFDMAQVEKLFHIFQRLHSPRQFSGTGLGLATVKQAVHLHGGEVWAEGSPGEGATFYFTLAPKVVPAAVSLQP